MALNQKSVNSAPNSDEFQVHRAKNLGSKAEKQMWSPMRREFTIQNLFIVIYRNCEACGLYSNFSLSGLHTLTQQQPLLNECLLAYFMSENKRGPEQ